MDPCSPSLSLYYFSFERLSEKASLSGPSGDFDRLSSSLEVSGGSLVGRFLLLRPRMASAIVENEEPSINLSQGTVSWMVLMILGEWLTGFPSIQKCWRFFS